MNYYFNFAPIWRNFDHLVIGLLRGLSMAMISLLIGSVIGLLCAYVRLSPYRLLRTPIALYVEFIRNAPLLLLIFFVYFGFPAIGITALDKEQSFVLTLSAYAGAYLTEVFRAGLGSMPVRYSEAAKAIGLRPLQRQRYVVLPVMFRIVLPSLTNNFISLFKDTSLAAAIAVQELTYYAREINTNTFRVIETWAVAGALYLGTCYLIAFGMRRLERAYSAIR
jgi:His/Glu/Gln/Arg/opine family amino acid ABC transporter permease subunit